MDADVAILTTEDATAAALSSGLSFSPVSAATATTAAVAATVAATTVVSG